MTEFKTGQYITLSQDIETKGDILLLSDITYEENFLIRMFSGMTFQIVSMDRQFNTLYAGSIKEKGIVINVPIDLANKLFKIT